MKGCVNMDNILLVISIVSVLFLFISVLICAGVIYIIYLSHKMIKAMREGMSIQIVQNDEVEYDKY